MCKLFILQSLLHHADPYNTVSCADWLSVYGVYGYFAYCCCTLMCFVSLSVVTDQVAKWRCYCTVLHNTVPAHTVVYTVCGSLTIATLLCTNIMWVMCTVHMYTKHPHNIRMWDQYILLPRSKQADMWLHIHMASNQWPEIMHMTIDHMTGKHMIIDYINLLDRGQTCTSKATMHAPFKHKSFCHPLQHYI